MEGEMLKGHLDMIVLAALSSGPAHGYAVIQEIQRRSGGAFELPEGTIYPALHRLERLNQLEGVVAMRGTERGYPDIEIEGPFFGDGYHAVDVKVARRARSRRQTDSRITLYTGNTYFRYPTLQWPGTFRPFQDYQSHLDVIAIYTLNETSHSRIDDFELIVQEPWRIASKQRSSTTREYLGAVMSIDDLRAGRGEFKTPEEFYSFWRRYQFRIGRAVQQQLDRLLAQQRRP